MQEESDDDILVLPWVRCRRLARRVFLRRPLVDGPQGCFLRAPALWFLGSLLLRTGLDLTGFYLVSQGIGRARWRACSDSLIARVIVVTWLTRAGGKPTPLGTGGQQFALVPMNWSSGNTGFSSSTAPSSRWGLMLVLAVGSGWSRASSRPKAISAGKTSWRSSSPRSEDRLRKSASTPQKYLGFLGTLFLFIAAATSARSSGYEPPTGSLSTTAALALCVFVAVPLFGIAEQGLGGYLKSYLEPT